MRCRLHRISPATTINPFNEDGIRTLCVWWPSGRAGGPSAGGGGGGGGGGETAELLAATETHLITISQTKGSFVEVCMVVVVVVVVLISLARCAQF